MVARVVPPLALLIGPGRPCNWLVTNKWNNLAAISGLRLPMLLLVSMLVRRPGRSQGYARSQSYVKCSG